MSAFTCTACGGFKYNQTPVMRGGPNDLICQDCFENGAMDAPGAVPMLRAGKPGLHEVLVSIRKAEFGFVSYDDWVKNNGGSEEEVAKRLQACLPYIWEDHYQRIIGEPWQ